MTEWWGKGEAEQSKVGRRSPFTDDGGRNAQFTLLTEQNRTEQKCPRGKRENKNGFWKRKLEESLLSQKVPPKKKIGLGEANPQRQRRDDDAANKEEEE